MNALKSPRFSRENKSSLWWADDALFCIDQRMLPHELRLLRITTVDQLIEAITTLAIRGAPALGCSGAFGVVLAASAYGDDSARLRSEAERIAAARPTAVNLAWGVQRALSKLHQGVQAALDEALDLLAENDRVNQAAATAAADLVQQLCGERPLRIITHCNTGPLATAGFGTALGTLEVLHSRCAIDMVLVDETRPLLQGARLTTWELAEAGIPHRLMIDSAAAWAMATKQVDCVLVGADRITAEGSVANKIGTYGLALAAGHHGIPFIVVAPESTRDLDTAAGDDIVVEERAATEITQIGGVTTAPEGTAVFNPAFDVTPPRLITAVGTENGVVDQANVILGQQIADVARGLYAWGWMAGTAGNISVRSGATAVITVSGLSKGELTERDAITVHIAGSTTLGAGRPSAETPIHTAIYRATDAGAVVHVHPPYATAASVNAPSMLSFTGYEFIKGLGAIDAIDIPVFANHRDVTRIAAGLEDYLRAHPDAPPVLFIAGHGVTAWGASLAQARDRVECLEAMCQLVALTGRGEIGHDRE